MKDFNWKDFLKRHPLFWSLNEKEIEQLLKDEVSDERDYPQGRVIIREGEVGDSVFLIGSGSPDSGRRLRNPYLYLKKRRVLQGDGPLGPKTKSGNSEGQGKLHVIRG